MHNDHNHPPPGRPAASHSERQQLGVEAGVTGALRAQDHWRVNLAEDWEIGFWSREFGCNEHELRRAVDEVGSNAGAVRDFIARSGR
jgi:AraC-like DNA-binding protein